MTAETAAKRNAASISDKEQKGEQETKSTAQAKHK